LLVLFVCLECIRGGPDVAMQRTDVTETMESTTLFV